MPTINMIKSDKTIEALKPGAAITERGLRISNDRGVRVWSLRYSAPDGKRKEMVLGRHPVLSLAAARALRDRHHAALLAGSDPKATRKADEVPTFGQVADQWFALQRGAWKSDIHAKQVLRSLEVEAEALRGLPVDQITKTHCQDVVQVLCVKGNFESAQRLRNRIELVLTFAQARGHISEDKANPARKEAVNPALAKQPKAEDKHHAAMAADAVPEFLGRVRAAGGRYAAALELIILTGVRAGEALGAKRGEFDLEKRVWTIPASRMKANKTHVVPMSDRVVELVRAAMDDQEGDVLFSVLRGKHRGEPIMSQALWWFARTLDKVATVHGFRSTLRSWSSKQGHNRVASELILAHDVKGIDFLEERRAILDAWADHCG